MKTMQFFEQNLLNTTTMVTVDSGTGTVGYLFDRNLDVSYQSSGYTGATSTTITITFPTESVISRLMIQNHNLKSFSAYYNTASAFNPAIGTATNSDTYSYFTFASVTAASISIQMSDVIDAGQERTIGELYVGDAKVQFDYNPHTDNYDPKLYKQKIKHTMPDGGTNLFIVGNKYQANITLKFIGETFHDALKTVYDAAAPLYFVPEATTSGWAGQAHEVVWVNDWDFTYAENSKSQGYNGKIQIEETPNT
jgi:hypothetical protein